DDEKEEPQWANDDYFVDFGFDAFVFDVVDDVENTNARSFFSSDLGKVGVAWHNPALFGVFFVSKDFFIRKERDNLKRRDCLRVNVTFVGNHSRTSNLAGEEEARDVHVSNISFADSFAGNFSVNKMTGFEDGVNFKLTVFRNCRWRRRAS
ncbi:hypothetical protein IIZ77_01390, partial [Candidatus Saccharibacteria bacterium]|nr:hypothetical protein [Candidatus Saccharibacteria bacterium]